MVPVNIKGRTVYMTPADYAAMQEESARREAEEARRPLTAAEVADLVLRKQINEVDIDDQTSLRMVDYYPTFEAIIGQTVKQGYKFTYDGQLWKTAQPELTIQAHYTPGAGTESLYTRIDEEHTGEKYDPIPYEGNMELLAGKYYTQDGVLYICTRDTGAPVHHALAELVGLYVEVAG